MSYSNLFMKSMYPKAPLRNGVGRYVCQLQRITLKFCKTHGGSKGIRYDMFFLIFVYSNNSYHRLSFIFIIIGSAYMQI